jgi:hypothetical protein
VVEKKDANATGGVKRDVYYYSPAPDIKKFKKKYVALGDWP